MRGRRKRGETTAAQPSSGDEGGESRPRRAGKRSVAHRKERLGGNALPHHHGLSKNVKTRLISFKPTKTERDWEGMGRHS